MQGLAEEEDWTAEYSLRGVGKGTLVVLDAGVKKGVWEQVAVALPNDVEVLRIPRTRRPVLAPNMVLPSRPHP